MISETSPSIKFYGYLLLAGLIAACGTDEYDNDYDSIEAPEVELNHVFDITDSEETMMSGIGEVLVTSDGSIMLIDNQQANIHVYDDTGDYQHSFIESGSGPGEVEMLGSSILSKDDDLFVFDFSNQRFSQFDRMSDEWEFNQSFSPGDNFPTWFYPIEDDHWVFFQNVNPFSDEDQDSVDVTLTNMETGDEEEVLISFGVDDMIAIDNDEGAPMMSLSPEYHNRNLFDFGENYLVHSKTGELSFSFYEFPDFEKTNSFTLNRPVFSLSENTKDEYVERFEDSQAPVDNLPQEIRAQMADEKAVVRYFQYDPAGYIWAQVHGPDGEHPWLVLDQNGEVHYNTVLDYDTFEIRTIRDGRIFVVSEDESGLPKVRVYEYEV